MRAAFTLVALDVDTERAGEALQRIKEKTNEWNEREKKSKVLDGNISSVCIYTGEHPC